MDTLNDLNERVDAFVGTSSFDTPAATNDQAPIDVPAEVHEDIVASVDFSEVELADEFTETQVAVTPNGLLPMEPLPDGLEALQHADRCFFVLALSGRHGGGFYEAASRTTAASIASTPSANVASHSLRWK